MEDEHKTVLTAKIANILMTYGVKSVNMDDIAKHLSISKKTLYKYFKDKNDVVKEVAKITILEERNIIHGIKDNCENAIDAMIQVTQFVQEKLKDSHPAVMFDLQKFYPEAFKLLMEHKKGFIKEVIINNTNNGVAQGLYRDNINAPIVASLFLSNISEIMNLDMSKENQFSYADLHLELVRYHIRGIASEKGVIYLKQHIKKGILNI